MAVVSWWRSLLSCLVLGAIAAPAHAAPLAFTGSIAIEIGSFGVGVTGQGFAEVDQYGHLGSLGLPANAFQAQGLVVTITTTAVRPIYGLQVTAANQSGQLDNPAGGPLPLLGAAKVCLYGVCGASTNISNLTVPLSVVGQAATVTVSGPVDVTVVGAPWTVGTAAVGTATAMGYAYGPASQTSSTARGSGAIQLVTPIAISTNLPGAFAVVPAFGLMMLHFVPEPTTLVLFGAGLAATAVAARRRPR
jgi:hypothetical protein